MKVRAPVDEDHYNVRIGLSVCCTAVAKAHGSDITENRKGGGTCPFALEREGR